MAHRPEITSAQRLREAPVIGAIVPASSEVSISGATLDSRAVRPGDLYAALPGLRTHGARFADQAIAAGAAAILTDPAGVDIIGPAPIPVVVVPDPRAVLGEVSAWAYGNPAKDLQLIGVTGTNGKTTMTHMIAAAWAAMGCPAGLIGTIGIRVGEDLLPSARTTPEAPDVHALLALLRERGLRAAAMEVSSHALALGRVDGIVFDVAVFTNLSQDHLDFHGTMADYFAVKSDLFTPQRSRVAVVCVEDDWGRRLARSGRIPTTTYSARGDADWCLTDVEQHPSGAWRGRAAGPDGIDVPLGSRLPGGFNRSNALGALAALVASGSDPQEAAAGVATCTGVPGRMEPVGTAHIGAFVDYAHTPAAVGRVIETVRGFCAGRVLVVLGCGGDRDPGKRPQMGRVAAAGADLLIVTDDNPRWEDPAAIRAQMLAGARHAPARAEVVEIGDRAAAIAEAVSRALPGDAVLVLGKGHEAGQEIQGQVTAFDDRSVLSEALRSAGRKP